MPTWQIKDDGRGGLHEYLRAVVREICRGMSEYKPARGTKTFSTMQAAGAPSDEHVLTYPRIDSHDSAVACSNMVDFLFIYLHAS